MGSVLSFIYPSMVLRGRWSTSLRTYVHYRHADGLSFVFLVKHMLVVASHACRPSTDLEGVRSKRQVTR